jgi:hypothetical protein
MSKAINDLEVSIGRAQVELQRLKGIEAKKWDPKGGEFWVSSTGETIKIPSSENSRLFGTERETPEAAKYAYECMRYNHRLLAYVEEFGGGWVADWEGGNDKYYLVYSGYTEKWGVHACARMFKLGCMYMSEECAEGLAVKLNSGEVVL